MGKFVALEPWVGGRQEAAVAVACPAFVGLDRTRQRSNGQSARSTKNRQQRCLTPLFFSVPDPFMLFRSMTQEELSVRPGWQWPDPRVCQSNG